MRTTRRGGLSREVIWLLGTRIGDFGRYGKGAVGHDMGEYQRIGEMLLRKGRITRDQLNTALAHRVGGRRRLGQTLVEMNFASEADITDCLAEQYGFDVIDPSCVAPHPAALELLSDEIALAHTILPLQYSDDCIECVMADPLDFPVTDMISRLSGRRAVLRLAPFSVLMDSIRKAYGIADNRSRDNRRRRMPPKVQEDRAAILAGLDDIAYITDEVTPVSHPLGVDTNGPAKGA